MIVMHVLLQTLGPTHRDNTKVRRLVHNVRRLDPPFPHSSRKNGRRGRRPSQQEQQQERKEAQQEHQQQRGRRPTSRSINSREEGVPADNSMSLLVRVYVLFFKFVYMDFGQVYVL